MRVVFVHGACVKDGSWWWHRTAELLAERDVASEAPALPSCGETGEPVSAQGPGLAEDVAAVRGVLTASDEPTVVVAHSYGGIVTAEAAAGVESRAPPAARVQLPARGRGEPLLVRRRGARPVPRRRSRGRHVHRPAGRPGRDVPAGLRGGDPAAGHDKTARQSLAVLGQPVQSAAWQQVPSTYLVCAQDRGTPAERQREFARRAGSVVELEAGHHPFLSQPAAVRDLVLSLDRAA